MELYHALYITNYFITHSLYHALYITNYFITHSIYPTNFIYYVYNTLHIPHCNRGKQHTPYYDFR